MFNVAVVTPVFNTQDYLHRCIKSVLGQKGISLQYFIVDDGSTDNSASIAQYYQQLDPRITFIGKCNEGQGTARNVAIKLADAEYIYFVDSDDHLGENALATLYSVAKEHSLDICSPNVPKHYFAKPLENVPCLPCKSQFIRLDLIREFNIFQPAIRSGQDGVFSHLVLTHCKRIGMAAKAEFHYTHARDGSTFSMHLKRHDLVPTILAQHYVAIREHYIKNDLWEKNAIRLLNFISDESLRNRVDPHWPYFDFSQKESCIKTLSAVAREAFRYISSEEAAVLSPGVLALAKRDVADLVKNYESEFLGKKFTPSYPKNSNVERENLIICKFANEKLTPSSKSTNTNKNLRSLTAEVPREKTGRDIDFSTLQVEIQSLRGKMDLAINSINNSSVQLASIVRTPLRTLEGGMDDLVVSLTTLPHRLPLVHYAIESIFSQTIIPARIVLWITDKIVGENWLTPELKGLVNRGLEIRKVEDVGPHTKLIYALKEYPNKSIITIDDDIIYPINTIQFLREQHLRFPGAVICNWARELAFDSAGKVKGVRSGRLLSPPLLEKELEQANHYAGKPNLLAFPYGTSGVLYPPGALHSRVFDVREFKEICPKEDDIWFKAMGLLNKTGVVVTNLGINPSHHCITGSQAEALRHHNHGENMNNKQMLDVFDRLDLYKYLK